MSIRAIRATDRSCFTSKGFVPARLGAQLLAEAPMRLGYDRRLWRYDGGVYRPDGDDWTKHRGRELLGERFRRRHLDEVIAWVRAQLPSLGHAPPVDLINCRNGLLHWRTGKLMSHSPDVLSTNQIPIDWKPRATCPRIIKFFAQTIPWDALDLIEELFGYALYPGNPYRKAVLLLGPGANGKSTLLGLFRGLLGTRNVAAVSLQALGEERFAAADLFGKLANVCGDIDARTVRRTDLFKQLTGGDPVRAEFKFRDAFEFLCFALPLFSANEVPSVADQTDAWFDRWITIPMEQRFDGKKADTKLGEKLVPELPGLLVHAVKGLRRLMTRGSFELPLSIVKAGLRYRLTLDTVRAFIAEEYHFAADAWVDRAALYRRYRQWCDIGGHLALSNTRFNENLARAFGDRIALRKRHGRPGWLGLARGPSPSDDTGDEGDAGDDSSPQSHTRARGGAGETKSRPPHPQAPPANNDEASAAGDGTEQEREEFEL
jgi:putative DNA primase/helicase